MRARLALRRDAAGVSAALADAFTEDPVTSWITGFPDDPARRRAAVGAYLFDVAADAAARTGQGYLLEVDGAVVGAALWYPPDTEFFSAAEGERIAAGMAAHAEAGAQERSGALLRLLHAQEFPERTAFHLQFLGVAGAQRSRGLGAHLIAPVLARCDLDGLPAALESSNPRNLDFYRRHGFEVVWRAEPAGGPVLHGMWRPPQPPSA